MDSNTWKTTLNNNNTNNKANKQNHYQEILFSQN